MGVSHAARALSQHRCGALTHLRAVNPLLLSAAKGTSRNKPMALPRQDAPAGCAPPAAAEQQAVQGVSSFAFQGTNAHAVLCITEGAAGAKAAAPGGAIWRRQRHWYASATHQLLRAGAVDSSRREAHFQTPLGAAALGVPPFHQCCVCTLYLDTHQHGCESLNPRGCSQNADMQRLGMLC